MHCLKPLFRTTGSLIYLVWYPYLACYPDLVINPIWLILHDWFPAVDLAKAGSSINRLYAVIKCNTLRTEVSPNVYCHIVQVVVTNGLVNSTKGNLFMFRPFLKWFVNAWNKCEKQITNYDKWRTRIQLKCYCCFQSLYKDIWVACPLILFPFRTPWRRRHRTTGSRRLTRSNLCGSVCMNINTDIKVRPHRTPRRAAR